MYFQVFHCVHFECPAETTCIAKSNAGPSTLQNNVSGSNSNSQSASSENYISAEYSPQDAPEADRMDDHGSDSES